MEEIWKDIEGYEGLYQVSNLGNVKSLDRVISRNGNFDVHLNGRLLKQGICKSNGYRIVSLWKANKSETLYVHRLVAKAFIPNPQNLPFVNHKDETRDVNCFWNLEWCTHEYNINYGTANKRMRTSLSKPVLQYSLDGDFVKEWSSAKSIEQTLGLSQGNISNCCRGLQKKAYGYKWKYKDVV